MLELRTLGTLGLRDSAGAELRAVVNQPKRLALLAYLAIEGGARWVRRDVLLGLFWPELDQTHARAALRRALFFLRQALGDQTLEGRGDEELRILPGSLWCDVPEFESALDANRLVPAIELYQGPLLEGFYIAGAPDAEAWLDRTRSRLHQLAARTAWRLAEDPNASDEDAAKWARRAGALAPDDEDSVRRLMNHLQRLNDRTGALAAYEEYSRRLRLDQETEPSGDLQSLAIAIRHRTGEPSPASTSILSVAINPFEINGDPGIGYLRDGLVNLFGSALDGLADFRLARSLGANCRLRGSLVVSGERMRLSAALDSLSGENLGRADAEGVGEEAVFQMVDQVVRQLVASRGGAGDQRLTRLASRTTTSVPALRTWLEGENHFRAGRFLPALDAYQRSTSIDPDFSLAHYRLASSAAASALIGPARSSSRAALALCQDLSERERLLVEAQDAWLHGATDEAERRYAAVVANYPDDFEAWFLLGDLLFHGNPYRGQSIRQSRGPLERALALDPQHLSTLVKLARLAALDRDWTQLDGLVNRISALSPEGPHTLGVRALRATALARTGEYQEILSRLRDAPALAIAVAFSDVALYGEDLADAARLGPGLIELFRSAELQAFGHLVLANIAVSQRDLDLARAQLTLSQQLDFGWGIEIRGLLAALPFVPWPDQWVIDTRSALQQWDPASHKPNVGLPLAFHNNLHPHIRAYLLGLLSARQNDEAGLIEAVESLAELAVPEDGEVLIERMERSIRAELLVLRGEAEQALIELTEAPTDVWFQYAVASPFFGGGFERWRRGKLLQTLGRTAEASRWLGSIAERSPWELPFRLAT